jgi:hypothetical protein
MTWNPSPQVAIAREAAVKLGADRVVIVYTTAQGQFGYASYGETRPLCASAKKLGDVCYEAGRESYEEWGE